MKKLLCLLSSMLLALVLANCTQGTQNSVTPLASGSVDPEATAQEYRIGPRDLLQINVFQVPDLNRAVLVNGAGFVVLPLVGNVHVAGKTTDQAQQEIAAKLGKTYLRSPQVSVAVTKSGQRRRASSMSSASRESSSSTCTTLSSGGTVMASSGVGPRRIGARPGW